MSYLVDKDGYYGEFGGAYIPEILHKCVTDLREQYLGIIESESFQKEYNQLLRDYVGRPSPLYYANRLSQKYGAKIYLKREDLNHTGAHKINNTVGQILVARHMGKTRIIAETGAGQHGVALATAAAYFGLECDIYMGEVDIEKQAPNVARMKLLGARVIPVSKGLRTLKEAVDAAFEAYSREYKDAIYCIGTAAGPHPFPLMVRDFQQVIGDEARAQFVEMTGHLPDMVIACVGGGSNSIGTFVPFLADPVELYGVEPLGRGPALGDNAASISFGKAGVMHVLCEGGLKLARSLADAGLVDDWVTVLAPKVIGSRKISQALCGEFDSDDPELVRIGTDMMFTTDFSKV